MVSPRGSAGAGYMARFPAVVALPGVGFATSCRNVSNLVASVAFEVGFCDGGSRFISFLPCSRIIFVFLRLGLFSLLLLGLSHFGARPLGAAVWPSAVDAFFWLFCWVFTGSVITPAFGTCGLVLLAGIGSMSQFVAFRAHQWLRSLF